MGIWKVLIDKIMIEQPQQEQMQNGVQASSSCSEVSVVEEVVVCSIASQSPSAHGTIDSTNIKKDKRIV